MPSPLEVAARQFVEQVEPDPLSRKTGYRFRITSNDEVVVDQYAIGINEYTHLLSEYLQSYELESWLEAVAAATSADAVEEETLELADHIDELVRAQYEDGPRVA